MNVFKRQYKNQHWKVLSTANDLHLFEIVNGGEYTIKNILKEHHRSLVYRIDIAGKDYVLKIPVEKNTRKWIRFTTLFRQGEAFKNLRGMLLYQKAAIPTTKPVMAAEKRTSGMVTDSWLLYEYLEAEPCLDREEYYPAVVATLKNIHSHGLLHGDPQVRNFMVKDDRIYVIDSNPKRAGGMGFSKAYEFAYLRRSAPGIEKFFGELNTRWLYRLACYYDTYERKFVRNRRKIKKAILPYR